MKTSDARLYLPSVTATAIALLVSRGYETTTVDELAAAADTSRSTFFRRFGSKEAIVFADHDFLLERLRNELDDSTGDPFVAVQDGTRRVLEYHLQRPEASRGRHELLQHNPALRDRELVASHEYERTFASFLRKRVEHPDDRDWVLVTLAAALVSTHNFVLRAWLRDSLVDASALLAARLAEVVGAIRPLLRTADDRPEPESQVVVAVLRAGETPAQALARIAATLGG